MNALRISTLAVVVMFSQGCALFASAGIKPPAGVAEAAEKAERIQKLGAEATKQAEAKCENVLKAEVGFDEERAIGGVVGVELISSSGHLFLDGVTEKNPETLNKDLSAAKLPDNAINDLTSYVSVVGKNLARYSARPDLPWTFAVIKNDAVNAFSAPGGYVVVSTGLLKKITNEAQLAGVLGHEIGHVVHKHSLKKYKDAKHKQCIAANWAAYMIKNGAPAGEAGDAAAKYAQKFDGTIDLDKEKDVGFIKFIMQGLITLLQNGNDKDAEFETDRTGLDLVVFAGYDASEYEKFLMSLGNQGGFFSMSHPATDDRVAKLKAAREGDLKDFATGTAKPDTAKAFAPLAGSK